MTDDGLGAGPAAELQEVLDAAHLEGDQGNFEGMAERLREGLEQFPGDPFVLCWLGVAERELGLDGVAYERFKQCLAADPEDPFVLATAGTALAQFDDPEAEAALRTAALLAPEVPLARWMYGAYLTREGQVEQGLVELEAARELDPDDALVAFELGVGRVLGGDLAGGIDALGRAAELDPDDGWMRVVLGLALSEADRPDEAATELEVGARLRDDDAEAQLLAALALAAAGHETTAWEMLERARFVAEGTDELLTEGVEERLAGDPAEAARFLRHELGPSAFRERLYTRP
jgi:tetratricopeptide (TPR) repeat protein